MHLLPLTDLWQFLVALIFLHRADLGLGMGEAGLRVSAGTCTGLDTLLPGNMMLTSLSGDEDRMTDSTCGLVLRCSLFLVNQFSTSNITSLICVSALPMSAVDTLSSK